MEAAAAVQDYNDPEVDAADDEGLDAGDDRKDAEDKPDVLRTNISAKQWASRTFLKPYQVLLQLSGFPNLTMLYSVFCCLPVSSASAERELHEQSQDH